MACNPRHMLPAMSGKPVRDLYDVHMDTSRTLGHSYHARLIDAGLQRALAAAGAVVIEGARATGKTMTAMHAASSYAFIDDAAVQRLIDVAPGQVLEGTSPRLLDEWQTATELWNLVRRAVDASAEPGRFILTGSAVPDDDATRHTGAGRFLRIRQRTMSWREKLDTVGPSVSLTGLFDGERPASDLTPSTDLGTVVDRILQPGFPAMTMLEPEQSAARLRGYIDDVARVDIHRLADIRHSPTVITQLVRALARSVASEVTFTTLAADLSRVAPAIDPETVSRYVDLLGRVFLVETQQPWAPTLRSRARVRTAPKLHLVDAALAAAALGAGRQALLADTETLGLLFETSVVHDLTVFAETLDGEVRHFRDSNGHEIDAIVSLPDGRWGAVEVKLGGRQLAAGAASLGRAVAQVDTTHTGEPAFRLVVTGTGPIVVTDDGTVSAPLHALAP